MKKAVKMKTNKVCYDSLPHELVTTNQGNLQRASERLNCQQIHSLSWTQFIINLQLRIIIICVNSKTLKIIIIHQTNYEKSDWSRAFNQFTIACELDMRNVLSAADNTFIMSSSMSAWLLSPLYYSPQKQNG